MSIFGLEGVANGKNYNFHSRVDKIYFNIKVLLVPMFALEVVSNDFFNLNCSISPIQSL
jgi:hypothetical protein